MRTVFGKITVGAALGATVWVASAATTERARQAVVAGGRFVHVAQAGDSLALLSARFGLAPALLAADNSLARDARLHVGQTLLIDNRHLMPDAPAGEQIVVNIPQRLLFHFDDAGFAAGYPIAVGSAATPTFVGPFEIAALEKNPTWDVPASIQEEQRRTGKPVLTHVPPGPENPLGRYWIGLSRAGFGIHGTNAPSSIYGFRTHGCIRLHPDDVSALFAHLAVGMRGRTIYEPVLLGRGSDDIVLLEVNPDPYRRSPDGLGIVRQWVAEQGVEPWIDWERVHSALRSRAGRPVEISLAPVLPAGR